MQFKNLALVLLLLLLLPARQIMAQSGSLKDDLNAQTEIEKAFLEAIDDEAEGDGESPVAYPELSSNESLGQQRLLIIGTAPVSGVYFPAGGAVCRMLMQNSNEQDIRCLVESTNGSEENLRGLMAGRLDIGIVQSDWHYFAVKGLASFKGSGNNNRLRSLFALHHEDIALVVRPLSSISTIDDLRGKRVNFGPVGSGQRAITEILLGTANISREELEMISDFNTSKQASAFCNNQIDAFFLPVVTPSYAMAEIVNGCEGRIVPLNTEALQKLIEANPFFVKSRIPADSYAGLSEDIETLSLRATLMTTVDLPEEIAYRLTLSIFDNFRDFSLQHLALRNLEPASLTRGGLTAPLHAGARRYFEEKEML